MAFLQMKTLKKCRKSGLKIDKINIYYLSNPTVLRKPLTSYSDRFVSERQNEK